MARVDNPSKLGGKNHFVAASKKLKVPVRIVFLDAGTLHYGGISPAPLKKLGDLKIYRQTPPSLIEKRLKGASIIITNKCRFDRKLLSKLDSVRLICIAATGTNNVDLKAARQKGIAVTNVSGYSTETVVQFTVGFLLALAGNLLKFNLASHRGDWSRSDFFTLPRFPFHELNGKVLGIVGYGKIGRRVAEIARVLGMKVLIAEIPGRNYSRREKKARVSFNFLLRHSDFITLHAPLSRLTQNLINARSLKQMKRGSFLINVARGGLVDEGALYRSLQSGHLAGAASDVSSEEPPPVNHPLLKAPNFLLTPHVAWASLEARKRLVNEVAKNIQAFLKKRKRNRVV